MNPLPLGNEHYVELRVSHHAVELRFCSVFEIEVFHSVSSAVESGAYEQAVFSRCARCTHHQNPTRWRHSSSARQLADYKLSVGVPYI